ncbi:MAG: hypothetical protein H0U27_07095 [Nitrosopumilus sp.]|nr:hypothetical protein [Nitrosopumilus sp.]
MGKRTQFWNSNTMPCRIPFLLLENRVLLSKQVVVVVMVVLGNNIGNIVFPVLLFSSFLFLNSFEWTRNTFRPSPHDVSNLSPVYSVSESRPNCHIVTIRDMWIRLERVLSSSLATGGHYGWR